MSLDEIEAQVEREKIELLNAPVVASSGIAVRCHWCGRPASNAVLVETVNGVERYKGECCVPK